MSASHAIWFELTLTGGLGDKAALDKSASHDARIDNKLGRLYALPKNHVKVMRHTSARIFEQSF